MAEFYDAVHRLVRQIPRGRVMTYGQIATILGCPRAARAVGYAMRARPRSGPIPWQRVINSKGGISGKTDVQRPILQRLLLESEGVVFNKQDRCDLGVYQWHTADAGAFFIEKSENMPF